MFEKLKVLSEKYDSINEQLMDPDVINDQQQYKNLMKEYKSLTPIIEKFKEYTKAKEGFEEAVELLDAGGLEKDFKEMVQMQYDECKESMSTCAE